MSELLKGITDKSLAASGYQKLPGGVILQWGTGPSSGTLAAGATGSGTITWPIAFPTACLNHVCYCDNVELQATLGTITVTGAAVSFKNVGDASGSGAVRYIAIGH